MRPQPTTTSQDSRRRGPLAHVYCARCVPRPRIGQTIVALCGTAKVYDGSPPGSDECIVCNHLLSINPFACGHPSPKADID